MSVMEASIRNDELLFGFRNSMVCEGSCCLIMAMRIMLLSSPLSQLKLQEHGSAQLPCSFS